MTRPAEGPYRVLVADDEPLARARLLTLLESAADFHVVAQCEDGLAARRRLATEAFDLVFLDMQMPGCDGREVVRSLPPEELPR